MRKTLTPNPAYATAIQEALNGQPIGSVFGVIVRPDGTTDIFV